MATKPFKGKFFLNTEALGAETQDLSNNCVFFTFDPDSADIPAGPFLGTNFRFSRTGSKAVGCNFRLEEFTAAQQKTFFDHWEAGSLMEVKYMPIEGAVIDTPTVLIPQIDIQFELLKGPTLPGTLDENWFWEPNAINVKAFKWDDGASPTTLGTFV